MVLGALNGEFIPIKVADDPESPGHANAMKDTTPETAAPSETHRSGFVAIIGRPNVGKSTLLNQLLGQKVAIVTPKPQTTRGRILGIKTLPDAQIIFIDTPGLHTPHTLINQRMVAVAEHAVDEADVRLWVVDATEGIRAEDRHIAERLRGRRSTCIALNKIDRLSRNQLLPLLTELDKLMPGHDVVPVSALKAGNLDELLAVVVRALPAGPQYYDAETFTDQTERMLAQEAVREQVLLQTRDEVPYAVAVTIDKFEDKGLRPASPRRDRSPMGRSARGAASADGNPTGSETDVALTVIHATIHVERDAQKGILIGARGGRIKEIGRAARLELERLLDRRVYLELFVRVQEEWTRHEARLREFGL
jgi:GTPase